MNHHRALVIIGLLLFLSACDDLPLGFTEIGDLLVDGAAFEGREVKIRGRVTDVTKIPLLDISGYTLEDDTGAIVVMFPKTLPTMGERIAIRGRVESLLILAGQGYGLTIREIVRLPVSDSLFR